MRELAERGLAWMGLQDSEAAYVLMATLVILLICAMAHFVLHKVMFRLLAGSRDGVRQVWRDALVRQNLFRNVAFTLQGLLLLAQARLWFEAEGMLLPAIQLVAREWVLLFGVLSFYALLNTLEQMLQSTRFGQDLPLRGFSQSIKLVTAIVALIFAMSLLIGKSPLILFSGLGAMTAVLLLVFKDPLLGLVAGIQLSANNMVRVGDWVEMPKYSADGDVIDIGLTTVKVQNWDKTITSIPSYALIADSFKNYRGMQEAGGRRIKRAINIDVNSVHFLDAGEIARLQRLRLLSEYIDTKLRDIQEYNRTNEVDSELQANGRRLTNLGTFRAYINAYLRANAEINQGMSLMVRQLAPGAHGIPLEIYCFTRSTAWVVHEGVQSDIFDHIFAIAPEFNLRLHQNPSGHDLRGLAAGYRPESPD